MSKTYDLIIIGAGSAGVPAALEFADLYGSVLVLDSLASPGQGDNKKAIGGIRATHSDPAKIRLARRSIQVFALWQEKWGDNIDWRANGYSYPAYTQALERSLQATMKVQQAQGLEILWLDPAEYAELNPGINPDGLRGATFSPADGSASPLLFIESAYCHALKKGARFRFNEKVTGFERAGESIVAVRTDKGTYAAGAILNAAGARARQIARLAGDDIPVEPDCHEAAVSEPVKPFMGPMVVDMRHRPGSANFYFYQAMGGQVIFCLTPNPQLWGVDNRSTSSFLPMIAKRMIEVMPRLRNLKVRRTWRGQYPMTPDGFPLVGRSKTAENLFHAAGMCGQGFMLGPGVAEMVCRLIMGRADAKDRAVLDRLDPYRRFTAEEKFK